MTQFTHALESAIAELQKAKAEHVAAMEAAEGLAAARQRADEAGRRLMDARNAVLKIIEGV